jgi:hypothetical protein
MADSRDLPAFMAVLLAGIAHKEAVELLAWLQLQHGQGQQQAVSLEQFEAAARDLLSARELQATGLAALLAWQAALCMLRVALRCKQTDRHSCCK